METAYKDVCFPWKLKRASRLSSEPRLLWVHCLKLSVWSSCGTTLTSGTHNDFSLILSYRKMKIASFEYSWYLSSSVNVCHYLLFSVYKSFIQVLFFRLWARHALWPSGTKICSKFALEMMYKKGPDWDLIRRVCQGYETSVSEYWTPLATSSVFSPVYASRQKGNPLSEWPAFVTFSCVNNAWQYTKWGTVLCPAEGDYCLCVSFFKV